MVEELPNSGEEMRLIKGIKRITHTPEIVTGTVSSTGQTVSVELENGDSYRLKSKELLEGKTEFRDSLYFELYTVERFQKKQKMNKAPGPRSGVNEVTDETLLPEQTHEIK